MTVKQMIERLQELPQDARVMRRTGWGYEDIRSASPQQGTADGGDVFEYDGKGDPYTIVVVS